MVCQWFIHGKYLDIIWQGNTYICEWWELASNCICCILKIHYIVPNGYIIIYNWLRNYMNQMSIHSIPCWIYIINHLSLSLSLYLSISLSRSLSFSLSFFSSCSPYLSLLFSLHRFHSLPLSLCWFSLSTSFLTSFLLYQRKRQTVINFMKTLSSSCYRQTKKIKGISYFTLKNLTLEIQFKSNTNVAQ